MKLLLNAFWTDESGMILSAEAALLGTVGIVGATVGLSAAAHAVDDELKEMAFAIRSLDQSFAFEGQKSEFAWTAGSSYTQPAVEDSQRELREEIERAERPEEQPKGKEKERGKRPAPDKGKPGKDHLRRRDSKKEASAEQADTEWRIDGQVPPGQAI